MLVLTTPAGQPGELVELLTTSQGVQQARVASVSPDPPAVQIAQLVWVSKAGSDITGNGTVTAPLATIPAAMALIASFGDATPSKRYGVLVQPGSYAESFILPANVFVIGLQRDATRLTGASITLDATWTPAGDHRSGLQAVTVTGGAKSFDMAAVSSNEGKLFFRDVTWNQKPSWSAFSNVNQWFVSGGLFFDGFTQNNGTAIYSGITALNGGAILLNGLAAHSMNAGFYGGACDGPFSVVQGLTAPTPIEVDFFGFQMAKAAALTLDGAAITFLANAGSLPASVTLLGGATSPRPNITGSKGANAALVSLMPALAGLGLLTDSTT